MVLNKQKIYIIMAIAIFGNLIFGFVMVTFLITQVNDSTIGYREAKEEQGNLIWRETQAILLKKTVAQNRAAIDEIGSVYLNPENAIEFIRLVERMKDRTFLSHTLSPLSFGNTEDGTSIVVSALTLTGSYNNTLQFIELFENMKFNAEINGISMTKTGAIVTRVDNIEESEVRTTINFFVYTL